MPRSLDRNRFQAELLPSGLDCIPQEITRWQSITKVCARLRKGPQWALPGKGPPICRKRVGRGRKTCLPTGKTIISKIVMPNRGSALIFKCLPIHRDRTSAFLIRLKIRKALSISRKNSATL